MHKALPKWAKPLFTPKRYKVLYGGRGSGKSHTTAEALLIMGKERPLRILCGREFQNSIAESVHKLLSEKVEALGMQDHYSVKDSYIVGKNGTEFIFKGVRNNVQSIKSMEGIDILWLEEAQTVSKNSWEILIPTIRKEGSEIWVTFNPVDEEDPTYQMFVDPLTNDPLSRDNAYIEKINWQRNPWFPQVLKEEMEYNYKVNPQTADHIWGGECKKISDAQIFKDRYTVQDFRPQKHWYGPYYGCDWGFSVDPMALIMFYIDVGEQVLYIYKEIYEVGVPLTKIADKWDNMEGARNSVIRADNSRPETINYMCGQGFHVEPAKKWSGSVEDGIEYMLKFYKIVVHTQCPSTGREFKKYSYKVDRLTGDITTTIEDKWNHAIDAIRYGLDPLISGGISILDVLK